MSVCVIIPTYRRVLELNRCVQAIQSQLIPPDELIVVCRSDDFDTRSTLVPPIREVNVSGKGGVVAAMNAGVAVAQSDLIALTDDDAAPLPDWLKRIEAAFAADSRLGALGGRDWQYHGNPPVADKGIEQHPGEMRWFGKIIGDHHRAAPGPPREVAVIKGVNCAFRTSALRQVGGFDTRLRGTGAQVHWELSACLALRQAGWKVVFDPLLGVDHFPAHRFDEDQRNSFNAIAQQNMVFNETLVMCGYLRSFRLVAFILWMYLVGTQITPGIAQLPRLLFYRKPYVLSRFRATMSGRIAGLYAALFSSKRIE